MFFEIYELIDFNECIGENGGSNCAPTATCSNIPGSFLCLCNSGYFGSGTICIGKFSEKTKWYNENKKNDEK